MNNINDNLPHNVIEEPDRDLILPNGLIEGTQEATEEIILGIRESYQQCAKIPGFAQPLYLGFVDIILGRFRTA